MEVEQIIDLLGKAKPLILIRNEGNEKNDPRITIKAEGGFDQLVIFFEGDPIGNSHMDMLEINGVPGTIEQWRKIFLPLLSIKESK